MPKVQVLGTSRAKSSRSRPRHTISSTQIAGASKPPCAPLSSAAAAGGLSAADRRPALSTGALGERGFATRQLPVTGSVMCLPLPTKGYAALSKNSQTRSKIPAAPCPMPTHIVTMTYFSWWRCNAWITVAARIAPVAPSGWPSAIAPPIGLTFAGSSPSV